jgi:hypothetical protein
MNLLVHVEQYDVLGILPSQLESLTHVAKMAGISRCAFVDGTADGVKRSFDFERFGSLEGWLEAVQPDHITAFTPTGGRGIENGTRQDTWLVFGPSMGWDLSVFDGHEVELLQIPGGVMNSRDAVPIALWELGSWPAR